MAESLKTMTGRASWILVFALAALACNAVPVHDVSKTFAIEVSEISESKADIKLDFLWVIDNSASMCQEQMALSRSFKSFVDNLQKYLTNLDIRVAVTTTDAIGMAGRFANDPAQQFPPACFESRVHPCLANEDCVKAYGPGWECKPYPANQMYNRNRSVNSTCIFRCGDGTDCCEEFCQEDYEAECHDKQSCLKEKCADAPNEVCTFTCRTPGSGSSNSGCLRPPDTKDCPSNLDAVLTMKELKWFKCNATVEPEQSYQANIEQGLRAAWLALDPSGPNAEQAAGFVRPDAYLVIVFVTDEDDCSIDPDFASPNYKCETDADCPKGSTCRTDVYFSKMMGQKIKLCYGAIKKDYYNVCSLLGDFKEASHHNCAYDLSCKDCLTDEDCDYGWKCQQKMKCRPSIYSLSNIASYQQPPGTPIFSLTPVPEFYSRFRSLKADPAKVLIATIVGDGIPKGPTGNPNIADKDQPSLISNACLADAKLQYCARYKELTEVVPAECKKNPAGDGCEEFSEAKNECIRECYIASKGDAQNPTVAKNSYVCESPFGKADFGARYVRLAEMFGPNGVVENLCAEQGIAPALENIAELVVKRVTKVCLPLESKHQDAIVVTKSTVVDGEVVSDLLIYGTAEEGGDYLIEFPTQECCFPDNNGNCTGTQRAIIFNDLLEPTATIEIRYEADFDSGVTAL